MTQKQTILSLSNPNSYSVLTLVHFLLLNQGRICHLPLLADVPQTSKCASIPFFPSSQKITPIKWNLNILDHGGCSPAYHAILAKVSHIAVPLFSPLSEK